jgi:hypothetical protein
VYQKRTVLEKEKDNQVKVATGTPEKERGRIND